MARLDTRGYDVTGIYFVLARSGHDSKNAAFAHWSALDLNISKDAHTNTNTCERHFIIVTARVDANDIAILIHALCARMSGVSRQHALWP